MTASDNKPAPAIVKVYFTCADNTSEEQMQVYSRDYVVLILALNSKTTSHLLCVPYKDALDMSSNLVQISHNAVEKTVTVRLCGKGGQKSFTANICEDYEIINGKLRERSPFLVTVASFWNVSGACLSLTTLPLILNDSLPDHLQFLQKKAETPAQETEEEKPEKDENKSPKGRKGRTKGPKNVSKKKITEENDDEKAVDPLAESDNPDKDGDDDDSTADANEEQMEKDDKEKSSEPEEDLSVKENCPVCQSYILMKTPDHVVFFAKHYYKHYPLDTQLLPIFVQTIIKLKKLDANSLSSCPLEFCKQPLDQEQTFTKHVRRRHQFEVLMLHLLMKDIKFLTTSLFKNLLEQCKNEKVREFIECLFQGKKIDEDSDEAAKDSKMLKLRIRPRVPGEFDKGRATDFMKQFFRDNYEDKQCQYFLTSRGEVLSIRTYEKLACFIFLMAEDREEAVELIKFALKNLKVVKDATGRKLKHEVLELLQNDLNLVYPHTSEYKKNCQALNLDPQNVNKDMLVALLQKLYSEGLQDRRQRQIFIKFLSTAHAPIDDKVIEEHEHLTNLTRSKVQEANFMCNGCSNEFSDVLSLLIHLEKHAESPESVEICCSQCQYVMEDVNIKEATTTVKSLYRLNNHYYTKFHLHNSKNEEQIDPVENHCDVCDIDYGDDNMLEHFKTGKHVRNTDIISEYLVYCEAKSIDAVNHREFPEFIFFLRYIHSMSVNLEMNIREIMDVVSRIHVNFSNLLNVNESNDVTDEVINKLSATEPSNYFCYPCSEGLATKEECTDHFVQAEDCLSVRCVVCRRDVVKDDIEAHSHEEEEDMVNEAVIDYEADEDMAEDEPEEPEETIPATHSKPVLKYNFKAKIQKDFVENVKFSVSLKDIVQQRCAPPRVKNIIDHCVEKRKADKIGFPLSEIVQKRRRVEAELKAKISKDKEEERRKRKVVADDVKVKCDKTELQEEDDDDVMIDEITDHSKEKKDAKVEKNEADIKEDKQKEGKGKVNNDDEEDEDGDEDGDDSFDKMIKDTEESIENIALFIESSQSVDKEEFEKEGLDKSSPIKVDNNIDMNSNEPVIKAAEKPGINILEVKSLAASFKTESMDVDSEKTELDTPSLSIVNVKSLKEEKQISLDPQRTYLPMDCDIPMFDISNEPQWKYYLKPQIDFLRKKAEVFNRWKNDINYYFNTSS